MQLISHPRSVPFGLGALVHVGKFVVQGDQMLGFVTDPERLITADQPWRPMFGAGGGVPDDLLVQLAVRACSKRAHDSELEVEVRHLGGVKVHGRVMPGLPVAIEAQVSAYAVEPAESRHVQVISAEVFLRHPDGHLLCSFEICIALSRALDTVPALLPMAPLTQANFDSSDRSLYLRVA